MAAPAPSPARPPTPVEDLRGSESSAYTERDIPIFTCVRLLIEAILNQLDGSA